MKCSVELQSVRRLPAHADGQPKTAFLLVVLAITAVLVAFKPSLMAMVVLWFVAGLLTFVEPSFGFLAWIMFLPLEGHFNAHGEIGPYIGLSPLVLVGLGLQALNNRKLEVRKDFMVFSMFFLGSVFLSGFTGVVSLTEVVRGSLSLVFLLGVVFGVSTSMAKNPNGLWSVSLAICLAVVVAILMSVSSASGSRLAVGDNVRSIANILGIAILILVMDLVERLLGHNSDAHKASPLSGRVAPLLSVFCMYTALLLTASRGVILSSAISIVGTLLYAILFIGYDSKTIKGKFKLVFLLVLLATVVLGLLFSDIANSLGGVSALQRFRKERFDENIRLAFWTYAIRQMRGWQWIFGAGIGAFRALVITGGYDVYSHSVYIDALTSLGLFGTGVLIVFMGRIAIRLLRTKNLLGICIFMYTFASFATHGSLSSKFFWLNIALMCGLSNIEESRRKRVATRLGDRTAAMPKATL